MGDEGRTLIKTHRSNTLKPDEHGRISSSVPKDKVIVILEKEEEGEQTTSSPIRDDPPYHFSSSIWNDAMLYARKYTNARPFNKDFPCDFQTIIHSRT